MKHINYFQRVLDVSLLGLLGIIHYKIVVVVSGAVSIGVTGIPVMIAVSVYLFVSMIIENENIIDGVNDRYSFWDTVFCLGPSAAFLGVIWILLYIAGLFD